MPSKWIEHVKEFAKSKGMTYRDALKCPECKSAYKGKGEGLGGAVSGENVSMSIKEIPKRGRPKKYATPEEAKKAKSMKTMESNKRKKGKMEKVESESDSDMEGGSIMVAGYKTEDANGLTHIYPISHEQVLQILKRLN